MKDIKNFVNEAKTTSIEDAHIDNKDVQDALDVIANYLKKEFKTNKDDVDGTVMYLLMDFDKRFTKSYDKLGTIIFDTMRDY